MRNLLRIFQFAIQGFFRNFWLSLVTVTMMIMAVFSLTLLLGIDYVRENTIISVENKVDILVSVKHGIEREEVETFVGELNDLDEVKEIKIITPEENKKLFEQSNVNTKIVESLEIYEEDENPFNYSLAIKAYSLDQYSTILDFVEQDQYSSLIKSSTHRDYDAFVNKINSIADLVNKYSWYITLIFALISILVIFNTIRISIYTRKNEIMIMKLVGAGNWFTKMPFLLEGVFYALAAILIVLAIAYPTINFIQPSLNSYFQGNQVINLAGYFNSNFLYIFGFQFLALAFLNVVSTAIAIRKYLKI